MDEAARIAASRRSVERLETDRARWTDRDSYLPFWDARGAAVAPLLKNRDWVCDLGCGAQALRKQLAPGTRYLPADIHAWTEDTETCELNEGRLPRRSLLRCDVAVMLGVLEYIVDPASLLRHLHGYAEHLLLTYCTPELWTVDRAGFGWVNALSEADLRTLLADAGYAVAATSVFDDRQLILQAVNTGFAQLRRLRRSASRRLMIRPAVPRA